MWELFNTESYTVQEVIEIIEDGLCYLFEFKIENGQLYYREIAG